MSRKCAERTDEQVVQDFTQMIDNFFEYYLIDLMPEFIHHPNGIQVELFVPNGGSLGQTFLITPEQLRDDRFHCLARVLAIACFSLRKRCFRCENVGWGV